MNDPQLDALIGREIVLDLRSRYVIAGTLEAATTQHLVLTDADVHDLEDTTTTREVYVVQLRTHGVPANRARVLVRQAEVVALAALADVPL